MGPEDFITNVDLPDFNKAKEIYQIRHPTGLTDIAALNWRQFMALITELLPKERTAAPDPPKWRPGQRGVQPEALCPDAYEGRLTQGGKKKNGGLR